MHDLIDQTVFLEKFGSLKSFWQILVRLFADHAWPSKTNHTFGFGDDDVTKRSITRHYAGGGRIGEHRNVRQARVGMPGERAAGLSHLHQTEHAFIHARAAGGRDDDDWNALRGGKLDHAGNAFAHHRTHGGSKKSKIHHGDCDFNAFQHSVTTQDRMDQPRRILIFFHSTLHLEHALKTKRIDRVLIRVHFNKAAGTDHA